MTIVRTIAELKLDRARRTALVPTMGAFHEGHLHLMRRAREVADVAVVSLFVNPTQFAAGEDFERYPRDEARDFALAEQAGVDVMFAPTVEEMYPPSKGQGTRDKGQARNEGRGTRNEERGSSSSAGVWEKGQGTRDKGQARNEERGTRNEERGSSSSAGVWEKGQGTRDKGGAEEWMKGGGEEGTTIHVGSIGELWEGAFRPGHFDGVATVVAKLFNIVRPDFAIFGLKDFQQCRVIQQMVEDLNFPIELVFEETVREADGLAMSSRNAYLSQEERAKAPMLHRVLAEVAAAARNDAANVANAVERKRTELKTAGFVVDYLEVVDARSLEPVRMSRADGETRDSSIKAQDFDLRAIVAARLGKTRLIDNVAV